MNGQSNNAATAVTGREPDAPAGTKRTARKAPLGKLRSPAFLLILFLCLLDFEGCRSIPNVRELVAKNEIAEAPPQVVGAHGPLSLKVSKELIARIANEVEATDILGRNVALVEAITGRPLILGNRVTLLHDGPETFASMTEAIRNARDHINLETFILRDDEVGRPLADLLIRKREEGVEVNVMFDSVGAKQTPGEFFERMRKSGLKLLEFNPISSLRLFGRWNINNRDHRKILVVDGKIAFTGGINFYEVYSKSSRVHFRERKHPRVRYYWRDTHIRVEGPAVAEFQRLFLSMWRLHGGPELSQAEYFPPLQKEGESLLQVIASSPEQPIPHIYLTYLSAISAAGRTIHVANAYLVPDDALLEALADAARKGVDVKIIVPSFSDFWLPFHAGRSNYSRLLRSGVKVYERCCAVLHSKTAVIDGVWTTVGSSNLDHRSFLHDAEVNAVIVDAAFSSRMEEMFAEDLAHSDEILLEDWEKRPFTNRIKEWIAQRFKYWL